MRLATFNIYWLGGDQIARAEEDYRRIAQVIGRLDADAMVFQEIVDPEVLEGVLDRVNDDTGRSYRLRDAGGRVLGTTGSSQKVVAAYDAGGYELLASSSIRGGVGRPPYALRLRSTDAHEAQVLVVGVHFQSGYPVFTDAQDADRRRQQCQHLAGWIAGDEAVPLPGFPPPLPGEHVVILGDFNALIESENPAYEGVVRSLDPLREGIMAEWWWEKPLPDPAGGGQTTSYLEGYLIDYVMLSPSLRERMITPPTIYAFDRDGTIGASGVHLSDHRPVYVDIDLAPEGEG